MKLLKLFAFTVFFGSAFSAHAFILSDVLEVNSVLISEEAYRVNFNLMDHGYNHLTDTITNIKISFNFREIIETEEDMDDWEGDRDNWEFVIFYSWIFDRVSVIPDVDTGILSFETTWRKTYNCQYYGSEYGDEICGENLDLYGNMFSGLVPYTNNLWLGEVRLDAEITRASIPEPASIFLLFSGLIGLIIKRSRLKNLRELL